MGGFDCDEVALLFALGRLLAAASCVESTAVLRGRPLARLLTPANMRILQRYSQYGRWGFSQRFFESPRPPNWEDFRVLTSKRMQ